MQNTKWPKTKFHLKFQTTCFFLYDEATGFKVPRYIITREHIDLTSSFIYYLTQWTEKKNSSNSDDDFNTAGDPTVFGNLNPPEEAIEAVVESVRSMQFNGYAPSTGKSSYSCSAKFIRNIQLVIKL